MSTWVYHALRFLHVELDGISFTARSINEHGICARRRGVGTMIKNAIAILAFTAVSLTCGAASALPTCNTPDVRVVQRDLVDSTRGGRPVRGRIYYPTNARGETHIIAVSHGGEGYLDIAQPPSVSYMEFYGCPLARAGFVVMVFDHFHASDNVDWARDVSFALDQVEQGRLALPGFHGELVDPDLPIDGRLYSAGHIGHSYGARASHMLGGMDLFDFANAAVLEDAGRDERIHAIMPISPQGPGATQQYDYGMMDSSWSDIAPPTYVVIGEEELPDNDGEFINPFWRATAFFRYPSENHDRFATVIPGQDHGAMGAPPPGPVRQFLIGNAALFFDIYLRNGTQNTCLIGQSAPGLMVRTQRKLGPHLYEENRC